MVSTYTFPARYPYLGVSMTNNDWSKYVLQFIAEGVRRSALNELAVSQRGAGANMSVDVATGRGYVQGDFGELGVTQNLDIATADATNARIDLVTLWVDWQNSTFGTRVLTGTPSGSPAVPSLTQTGTFWEIPLAEVAVAALAASIVNANITDRRRWASGWGATVTPSVASAATPNTPRGGKQLIVPISGTTTITSLPAPDATGTVLTLVFASAGCRVVDNGGTLTLQGDYISVVNGTLSLYYDGTNWVEVTRSNGQVAQPQYNLLVNGGFEHWQRGTGAFTTHFAWFADRWQLVVVTSTASVSRITSTIGSSGYSAQLVYTHASTGVVALQARANEPADLDELKNKVVTFEAVVKSTVDGTVCVQIDDSVGGSASSYNVGTGAQTLSVTRTISSSATNIRFQIITNIATATVEVNDARVYLGYPPSSYVPALAADDLARCLRYYERFGGVAVFEHFGAGLQASTTTATSVLQYHYKAITPSVTPNTASNFAASLGGGNKTLTTISASQITPHTCHLNVGWSGAQGAAGDAVIVIANNTTNALIEVEANP